MDCFKLYSSFPPPHACHVQLMFKNWESDDFFSTLWCMGVGVLGACWAVGHYCPSLKKKFIFCIPITAGLFVASSASSMYSDSTSMIDTFPFGQSPNDGHVALRATWIAKRVFAWQILPPIAMHCAFLAGSRRASLSKVKKQWWAAPTKEKSVVVCKF